MQQIKLKNDDTVIIREARSSDAKELLENINKISSESDFLTFGQGEFVMTLEQEEEFIKNIGMQCNALYIVAEVSGKIVGNLIFSGGTRPRTAHAGEFGLSVLKDYWGEGIGTELVKCLIEWGKQTGVIRKIDLKVRKDNFSAIHVYKKLGFTEEGMITRDLQINGKFYDALCMGYTID